MTNGYFHTICALVLGVIFPLAMHAQEVAPVTFDPTAYYVDLNLADGSKVIEINDEWLSIKYNDQYGLSNAVQLNIYDWKYNLITHLSLMKEFGLNYFTINLKSNCPGWSPDQLYRCEAINEGQEKFTLLIKSIVPPKRPDPVVDILVNPLHVDCAGLSTSTVKFFGQVSGAQAPYTSTWYVSNAQQTELLYQPHQEIILKPGNTSTIVVDSKFDYYVLLDVKDACGNQRTQTVHLTCKTDNGQVNTLFIEPVQKITIHSH